MSIEYHCGRCKKPVISGQTQAQSSIYGAQHLICESCFFDEEAEQESRGTNNLPDVLATYGPVNYDE